MCWPLILLIPRANQLETASSCPNSSDFLPIQSDSRLLLSPSTSAYLRLPISCLSPQVSPLHPPGSPQFGRSAPPTPSFGSWRRRPPSPRRASRPPGTFGRTNGDAAAVSPDATGRGRCSERRPLGVTEKVEGVTGPRWKLGRCSG